MKTIRTVSRTLTMALWLLTVVPGVTAADVIALAGGWRFELDRSDAGVEGRWYDRELSERVRLPGSLQLQGFGDPPSLETRWMGDLNDRSFFTEPRYAPYRAPGNFKFPYWLTPTRYYAGAAWYQRDVEIPESWRGKRVVLRLERPHWETRVWLDDRAVGVANSLAVAHEHDLTEVASPGRHRLTVRVDNRYIVPVGVNSHSVSDHTQGNWNGIAGAIELVATPRVWIDQVRVTPNPGARSVSVQGDLGNRTGGPVDGELRINLRSVEGRGSWTQRQTLRVAVDAVPGAGGFSMDLAVGDGFALWDEFRPTLYDLEVAIRTVGGAEDLRRQRVGLREVKAVGSQIAINGRPVFLRGTLECAIFPRTGYPPTDPAAWRRIMTVARGHGLNHLRFHSWTPPRAAFEAADELGFYLYVECPTWANQGATVGDGTALDAWVYAEGDRILREYGNHPSFILMSYGNEPSGKNHARWLGDLVRHWQREDPRRLYTSGAGWPMIPENDVHVTPNARAHPVHAKQGETAGDYSAWHGKQTAPILSHEIGQYCVFPNLGEIRKYDGWLQARNFEIVRDFLAIAGMSDQARVFLRASGKLQVAFYKDEIEACLRTPGWAGFELLDLHDFPGQGTALVGVLDPFWEEKGYVKASEFRRFCDETVPLARLPKRVWTSDETFRAPVDLAHFGELDGDGGRGSWAVRRVGGGRERVIAAGEFEPRTWRTGTLSGLGVVEVPLENIEAPAALRLEVEVRGGARRFANDWNFWVYPAADGVGVDVASAGAAVRVVTEFDAAAERALESGERVVVLAEPGWIAGATVGRFDPVFWNRMWFPSQPQHTLGLLMDPRHPALAGFPTEGHSDWQWQDLHNRSKPMVLTGFPAQSRPVIQVIDDWNTCRKLGLVVEAKVGRGRLLVCSIDLVRELASRPAARALRRSLLEYAAGRRFDPRNTVEVAQVRALFRTPGSVARLGARVVSTDSEQPGYEAARALDADPATVWHTAWDAGAKGWPHELVIELTRPAPLVGLRLLPRQDGNPNGWFRDYAVHASDDGEAWGAAVVEGRMASGAREVEVMFPRAVTPRFLKFVARTGFDAQPFASLAELDFLIAP